MYIAIQFSSSRSSDGAMLVGVFSTSELGIAAMTTHMNEGPKTERRPSDVDQEIWTWGDYVGQVFRVKVDEPIYTEV